MKKMILFTLILTSTTSAFAAKDPVVAKVNGVTITKSELEEAYQQNRLFVSDKRVTREKVLDDLINRELGINRAKSNNLDKNPAVKKKMEDVLYHAQVSKDLEPKLKKIVVTDDDVKSYYNDYPEYRTAHILFRVRANPEEKEAQAALEQALSAYKTLEKKPDQFSELANKYSQSSTAPNGGDMGFQPAVRLAPEYFQAIKGKNSGHVTSPVRTQFGYHIIKVLAKKDYKDINMALYKKIVYDQKRDKILGQYFEELRKKAKVTVDSKLVGP